MECISSQALKFMFLATIMGFFMLSGAGYASAQDTAPRVFASPQEAISTLMDAAKKNDRAAMLEVLGSDTKRWITSGDPVQDRRGLDAFIADFDQKNEIEKDGDSKAILVVGDDGFPFPFPIIKSPKGWAFNPEQGREELLDRRVGRNELTTIKVLQAFVDAQSEYASVDRNGDGVLEYAAKLRSSPGKRDGLYWPTEGGGPLSPLGPLVAEAVQQGYSAKKADDKSQEPRAFHGYLFKLLKRQGDAAPGGARDFVVAGRMIGGFAVLAYPARFGNSGVMTFMTNQDGVVYQADHGSETAKEAQQIDAFNPGDGWEKVEPE